MFHLFDQEGKSSTNEAGTTQPSFSDEKLDEIQMLQQAQSRLPAFCPHSSPFSSSCRSILSSFEWYAEEPLVGIDGAEPLLERPTVNFLGATSTADHRTDLDQVLLPSEDSTTTGEDLMHRLSVQHVENCPSIIAADPEVSPPFVVDTSTVSCRSRAGSPTPASPLTDLPIDDVDQAAPQFSSNTDLRIQRSSAETDANVVISRPASFDAQQATPMDEDATIGDVYDDCDSDSGRNEDAGPSSCRYRDADDSDDEDAEEEPQLSPRLVDARALYEAYLQTGEKDEWSSTSSDGDASTRSEDDDSDDDSDGGVLVEFGEWQDQRALHRRNEDFPYHTYKPPVIGDGFQAALPSLLSEEQRLLLATTPTTTEDADSDEDDGPRQEELMWSPDSVNDELVEDYLAHVRELLDHDDFSEEKALVALHRHDYDANGALASLLVDPEPFHKDRWSDEEKIALVTGWGIYFKNWQKIQTMVPTRSTGEIMQFYYQHKPRADYIRRQNQAADDESESEESEEEELIGHLDGAPESQEEDMDDGAKTTPSSPSSPSSGFSSPHRPLPHQTDLAPVHMPLGEDESDHEVERQAGSIKRRWADHHAGEAGDNNDGNEDLEQQHIKKRKREAAVRTQHYREDNVDGADGEGNDKSEEDEERSAAAGTLKRARLDRGDNNDVDQGDDGDVWSRAEETTPRGTGQLDGASL